MIPINLVYWAKLLGGFTDEKYFETRPKKNDLDQKKKRYSTWSCHSNCTYDVQCKTVKKR